MICTMINKSYFTECTEYTLYYSDFSCLFKIKNNKITEK